MDNSEQIVIFNSNPNDIIQPNLESEQSELASDSDKIKKALLGEKVKLDLTDEELDIYPENYVIDLGNITKISSMDLQIMKTLLRDEGTVAVYLYQPTRGLMLLGMSIESYISKMAPIVKRYILEEKYKIYVNVGRGKKLQEVNGVDITKQRLNL